MNRRRRRRRRQRQPTAEAIQNVLATGNGLGLDALFGGGAAAADVNSMTSNADYSEGSSTQDQQQQHKGYQPPAILSELERDNNESIKMMSLIVLGN